MVAKDTVPPPSDEPGALAATWRETINGDELDDGPDGASVWCAAMRCTGSGGPTATVGPDATGREEGGAADGT
jgi:hypothetical protein